MTAFCVGIGVGVVQSAAVQNNLGVHAGANYLYTSGAAVSKSGGGTSARIKYPTWSVLPGARVERATHN